jgi:RNA polymerase sigma-70 factor (ECF subfamily)
MTRQLVSQPAQESAVYFEEMARAYWKMPHNQRQILMLVGGAGLGYEEAGKVVGCAVGTVRSRLSRARAKLQQMLDDEATGDPAPRRARGRGAAEFMQALAAA